MANDKMMHLGAGCAISLVAGILFYPLLGLILTIITGIGKEIWDYFGHGTCELNDFLATLQGGIVGFIILMIAQYLMK